MKKINDFLNTGEKITLKTNPYFLKIFLTSKNTIISLFLAVILLILNITLKLSLVFLSIPVILLILNSISTYIKIFFTNYYITTEKIIIETGWIGKDYDIVKLDRILDVNLDVSIIDSLFDTGSIKLCTANDSEAICLKNIRRPKTIIKNIKF